MTTIANLGIKVSSDGIDKTDIALGKLAASSAKSEAAIDRMIESIKKQNMILNSGKAAFTDYAMTAMGASEAEKKLATDIIKTTESIKASRASAAKQVKDNLAETKRAGAEQLKAINDIEKAETKRISSINKVIESLSKEEKALKMSKSEQAQYNLALLGASDAEKKAAQNIIDRISAIKSAKKAEDDATRAINESKIAKDKLIDAEKKRRDSVNTTIMKLRDEVAVLGKTDSELLRYKLTLAGATEAEKKQALALQKTIKEYDKTASQIKQTETEAKKATSTFSTMFSAFSAAGIAVDVMYAIKGAIKNTFTDAFNSVEDFKLSTASLAATLATFADIKGGNIADIYKQSYAYSEQLVLKMEEWNAKTVATGANLTAMVETLAQAGVVIDLSNTKQEKGIIAIGNALALVTKGQNADIQFRQEIRGLVDGEEKSTNRLAKMIGNMVDGPLKDHVERWKESGTLIENVGVLLSGFNAATKDLDSTWMAVSSTMETMYTRTLRGLFIPVYTDILNISKEITLSVLDQEKAGSSFAELLKNVVYRGWIDIKNVVSIVGDTLLAFEKPLKFMGSTVGLILDGWGQILAVIEPVYSRIAKMVSAMWELVEAAGNYGNMLYLAATGSFEAAAKAWVDTKDSWMEAGKVSGEALSSGLIDEIGANVSEYNKKLSEIKIDPTIKAPSMAAAVSTEWDDYINKYENTIEKTIEAKQKELAAYKKSEGAKPEIVAAAEAEIADMRAAIQKKHDSAYKKSIAEETKLQKKMDAELESMMKQKQKTEDDRQGRIDAVIEKLREEIATYKQGEEVSAEYALAQDHASTAEKALAKSLGETLDNLKEKTAAQKQYNTVMDKVAPDKVELNREKGIQAVNRAMEAGVDISGGYEAGLKRVNDYFDKIEETAADKRLEDIGKELDDLTSFDGSTFGNTIADGINNAVTSMNDLLEVYDKNEKAQEKIKKLQDELATGEGSPEVRAEKLKDLGKYEELMVKNQIGAYRQLAGTTSQLFKENSKERTALHNIEMAFAAIELAMAMKKTASTIAGYFAQSSAAVAAATVQNAANASTAVTGAVASVAAQGTVPIAGFAMVPAMIALMAGVLGIAGISFGGGGSSSGIVAPVKAKTQSGTVLGDPEASSDSLQKIEDMFESMHVEDYTQLKGIYSEVKDLNNNITGLVSSIYRGGDGGFTAKDMGINLEFEEGWAQKEIEGIFSSVMGSGGLVGKITNILGSVVGSIAGGGTETYVDYQGITTAEAVSIADLVAGKVINAQQFVAGTVKTKGGWFGNDDYDPFRNVAEIGDTEEQQKSIDNMFTSIFQKLGESFVSVGDILGFIPIKDELGNIIETVEDFTFKIGDIDLKNLETADEINKALNAAISTISDEAATELFGKLIGQYQTVGEGMVETAVRVASEKTMVLDTLDKIGSAFKSADIPALAIAFSQSLLDVAGGLENFMEITSTYYDKFFTDEEKQADIGEMLTESLKDFKIEIPGTRELFRDAVDGIDRSDEAGQEFYWTMLKLSGSFDEYYSYLEDADDKAKETFKSIVDGIDNVMVSAGRLTSEDIFKRDFKSKYGVNASAGHSKEAVDFISSASQENIKSLAEGFGVTVSEMLQDIAEEASMVAEVLEDASAAFDKYISDFQTMISTQQSLQERYLTASGIGSGLFDKQKEIASLYTQFGAAAEPLIDLVNAIDDLERSAKQAATEQEKVNAMRSLDVSIAKSLGEEGKVLAMTREDEINKYVELADTLGVTGSALQDFIDKVTEVANTTYNVTALVGDMEHELAVRKLNAEGKADEAAALERAKEREKYEGLGESMFDFAKTSIESDIKIQEGLISKNSAEREKTLKDIDYITGLISGAGESASEALQKINDQISSTQGEISSAKTKQEDKYIADIISERQSVGDTKWDETSIRSLFKTLEGGYVEHFQTIGKNYGLELADIDTSALEAKIISLENMKLSIGEADISDLQIKLSELESHLSGLGTFDTTKAQGEIAKLQEEFNNLNPEDFPDFGNLIDDIWALEDAAKKEAEAVEKLESVKAEYLSKLESELAILEGNMDDAKSAYLDLLNDEVSAQEELAGSIKSAIDSIKDYRASFMETTESTAGNKAYLQSRQSNLAISVMGGNAEDTAELIDISGKYLEVSKQTSKTSIEYKREVAITNTLIHGVQGKLENQLTEAEIQAILFRDLIAGVEGVDSQILTLSEAESAYNKAKAALDSSWYVSEITALQAINVSVLSLRDAFVAAGGTSTYNPVVPPKTPTSNAGSDILNAVQAGTGVQINDLLQGTISAKLQQMVENGTSSGLAAAMAIAAASSQVRESGSSISDISDMIKNVPGFASGGYNSGGLTFTGEKGVELSYRPPSQIMSNSDMMSELSNKEVVKKLNELIAEVNKGNYTIAKNTQESAKTLKKFDYDGLPEVRA